MDVLQFATAQLPRVPSRVLEVGCGDGRLARALDDVGYRVVAIDPAAPDGAMRRDLDLRFTGRWFAWTPSLYLELGEELEQEEWRLIEAGSIVATGFQYVGEQSGR